MSGWQKKDLIHERCHLWLLKGRSLISDRASWEDISRQALALYSNPPSFFCEAPGLSEASDSTLGPLMLLALLLKAVKDLGRPLFCPG